MVLGPRLGLPYYATRGLEQRHRRLLPTRANGQPAAGHYVWNEEAGAFLPHAIHVLTLRGAALAEIAVFVFPQAFSRFGLPARVDANPAPGSSARPR